MPISLDCPLCSARVADGVDALSPGRCPNCTARFEGDGDHPVTGVEAALRAFGAADLDAQATATALFALDPGVGQGELIGVASDERDGFYRWWVFVRDDQGDPAALLRSVASGA